MDEQSGKFQHNLQARTATNIDPMTDWKLNTGYFILSNTIVSKFQQHNKVKINKISDVFLSAHRVCNDRQSPTMNLMQSPNTGWRARLQQLSQL